MLIKNIFMGGKIIRQNEKPDVTLKYFLKSYRQEGKIKILLFVGLL
jgi:hypothetical protein